MNSDDLESAYKYRELAGAWRERAAERVGDERRLMIEIAGQYDKLAFLLERVVRLMGPQAD